MKKNTHRISRRRFLKGTAATVAAFSVVPSDVLALNGQASPNNKLNIACIGAGGRGHGNIRQISSENIVALCDVDFSHASRAVSDHPKARQFKDFRPMLDQMDKEIDAVMVSTPDHTHAVAVLRALGMGKHVFCEKPLAHSISEIRAIMKAADEQNVATQLGNQGHSSGSIRTFCEWIWDGAIGPVREVHAFCQSNYSRIGQLEQLQRTNPVPESLDWDLWLGPAPHRPYNSIYHPGRWRGWAPFGTGVIGDWTCHVLDPVFWALDLGAPTRVEAEIFDFDPSRHSETFPPANVVRFDFPARKNHPPVRVTWHDGAKRPARPEELEEGQDLPGIGALVVGEEGKIVHGSHGASGVRIIPQAKMDDYKTRLPDPAIPRSPGHFKEWIEASKGGAPCGSNFAYGGPLTELALLGLIAMRFPGRPLEWDGPQARFTNSPEANEHMHMRRDYRAGWTL
jgi:predicted dehydrogenase